MGISHIFALLIIYYHIMKKLFTIASASLVFTTSSFAQKVAGESILTIDNPIQVSMDKAPFDTIIPGVRPGCNDSLFVYAGFDGPTYSGFIAGTNAFGDKEKAQLVPNTAVGSVVAAFGLVGFSSGSGSYSAKVYSMTAGLPATVLGTSAPTPIASLTNNFIAFFFNTPVSVPAASFAISVPVEGAPGDTIAFATSKFGCGNEESFELWSDDDWYTINDAWGADLDIVLGVIIDRAAGISEANMPAAGIAPNPAADFTVMGYQTKENGNVIIKISNLAGQQVMQLNEGEKTAGVYTRSIDVSNLAAGTYVYEVSCNGKSVKGRMVVSK